MDILEHAKKELALAGYNLSKKITEIHSDEDYLNACAQNAYSMLKTFVKGDHSGLSAEITLKMFEKLARCQCLMPLTNNPEEWEDVSAITGYPLWQSKRHLSCFSEDMKTFYDIEAKENKEKSRKEFIKHKLKEEIALCNI